MTVVPGGKTISKTHSYSRILYSHLIRMIFLDVLRGVQLEDILLIREM